MTANFKSTDPEGRIRLGDEAANKQWQINELENGSIVILPVVTATEAEARAAFYIALEEHRKTIDALR